MTETELTTAVDTYLNTHLDTSYWSALPSDTKTAAKTMARADVEATVNGIVLDDIDASGYTAKCLVAAIAEQALYLSRHYSENSENKTTTSESVGGVSVGYTLIGDLQFGNRAAVYIKNLKSNLGAFSVRLTRG